MNTQPYVFEKRWFMLDFARMRRLHRGEMTDLLDILQRSGYNGLGLYVEGAFALPGTRGLPRPGCLTQDDVDLMMSHINSYKRESLKGRSPYERFAFEFGDDVPEKLGIRKIEANAIVLRPELLQD